MKTGQRDLKYRIINPSHPADTLLGPIIKITMVRAEHNSELVWNNPDTKKDETHL